MENGPDDFDLLLQAQGGQAHPISPSGHRPPSPYENITFMSQIRLPEGRLVSYPAMVFEMVGDAGTERGGGGERVFDYVQKEPGPLHR